ncbi:ABC transporter substrate-binding protein [Ruania suaedae]|uniref:ABC transporter substrate-binding protein n=1 Tax=Ruania suaedae TaxID=2897774 RepID=UPI001E3179D0|nr:ABC transporter substrate-binding protein [Ruania suaedae]UFU03588.1 ABC transporter substrate-binding protein [Ruania suaedae]
MSSTLSRRALLGAGLGGGVLAPMLGGCASLMPAASGDETLVVHAQFAGAVAGADVYRRVVQRYREEFGAQIATLSNGSDLPIVFETSVLAGKEADIAIVNMVGKTLAWTEAGATVPVNPYLEEWGLADRITDGAVEEWTDEQGRVRAFPYTRTNWPVAFNHRILEEVGLEVPTTTEELYEAADRLRSAGYGPVAIGGSDWTGQKLFMQILQSFLTPEQAREVFASGRLGDSPGAAAGVEHFVELREAGVFVDNAQGFNSDSMLTQYTAGESAIMSSMSSALALVPDDRAAETTIGGWPVPASAVLDQPSVIQSFNGMGLWISENGSRKLDLVRPFIEYLFSEPVIGEFILESGRDMNAITETRSEDYPLVAQAQDVMASGTVDPVILPDLLIPDTAFEPLTAATAQAYGPGVGADQIIELVETAYRNV